MLFELFLYRTHTKITQVTYTHARTHTHTHRHPTCARLVSLHAYRKRTHANYSPGLGDPEAPDLRVSRVLLVLQREVLPEHAHVAVRVQRPAQHAPEHVELRRVLRRVQLRRVHHQRPLVASIFDAVKSSLDDDPCRSNSNAASQNFGRQALILSLHGQETHCSCRQQSERFRQPNCSTLRSNWHGSATPRCSCTVDWVTQHRVTKTDAPCVASLHKSMGVAFSAETQPRSACTWTQHPTHVVCTDPRDSRRGRTCTCSRQARCPWVRCRCAPPCCARCRPETARGPRTSP